MINDLIRLATHLDAKGYAKESNYLDKMIHRVASDEEGAGESEEAPEPKSSKWHKMKMTRVVEEMDKNDFNSLSFELGGYTVRVTKKHESDD